MKHRKRLFTIMLVMAAVLIAMAIVFRMGAFNSKEQVRDIQAEKEEPITLTLWTCNDMVRGAEMKLPQEEWYITQAIDRFCEQHSNVTIEMTPYNDNAQVMNDFKASMIAGSGPDVVCFMNGPTLISLKDGLASLNDYIDDEMRMDIVGWDTCAEGMNADNTIYGMPYGGQSVACFAYNKSLVKQAGLDFEANAPRTLEDFYAALDVIKEAGIQPMHMDESYPGLLLYSLGMWWEEQSGLSGIIAHTDEGAPFTEDEGFYFMMEEYKKFYENGWLNQDTATSAEGLNVFLQGESAVHTLFFGEADTYEESLGEDFGMLAIPTTKEDMISKETAIGGVGAALAVSNFSKNQDMAAEFIKFLLSKEEI